MGPMSSFVAMHLLISHLSKHIEQQVYAACVAMQLWNLTNMLI